jgi:hypothetical protein
MMFALKDIRMTSLLVYTIVCFSSAAYANIDLVADAGGHGKAHGNKGGHEKSHGHDKGGQEKSHGHDKGGQEKSHGHDKSEVKAHHEGSKQHIKEGVNKSETIKFIQGDRDIIVRYFSENQHNVTTLPPGIAKNLMRGKPLPPGIAKVFLPSDLVTQLPVYPGYEYIIVDRNVILLDSVNGTIVDILTNILR